MLGARRRVELIARAPLGLGPRGFVGDENRGAHDLEAFTFAEHVLGAAEADSLRAVAARLRCFLGLVGVGPYLHAAELVRPAENLSQAPADPRSGQRSLRAAPMKTSPVVPSTLSQSPSSMSRALSTVRALFAARVDEQRRAARDAGLADLPSHDGRVRRRAAAGGDDALRDRHAVKVIGRRLDADEYDALAARGPCDGIVGVEHGAADRGTRRRIQAFCEPHCAAPRAVAVEAIAQQLLDLRRLDARDGFFLRDQPFLDHVDGDLDGGRGGALRGARLQHVQAAALDRELEILNVAIVLLELSARCARAPRRPSASPPASARSSAPCECPRRRPRLARWSGTRRTARSRRCSGRA